MYKWSKNSNIFPLGGLYITPTVTGFDIFVMERNSVSICGVTIDLDVSCMAFSEL